MATWQRYWLFQLPGLLLVVALTFLGVYKVDLPRWTIPVAVGIWAAKDLLMYPFLKLAYEGPKPTGAESMVGAIGTVVEDLCPCGFVKIGPELWRAESVVPIRAGHLVRVIGCDGMTMRVEATGLGPGTRP